MILERALRVRDEPMQGQDVEQLQAWLVELGFLAPSLTSGRFDAETETAVRGFQGLLLGMEEPSGIVRAAEWLELSRSVRHRLGELSRWRAALAVADTTGASITTAAADNLPMAGVDASRRMAESDLQRLSSDLKQRLEVCGDEFDVPPEVLAAIASRESRTGTALNAQGTSPDGHAFGIMQVDNRHHVPASDGGPSGIAHIRQASGILSSFRRQVAEKHRRSGWEDKDVLKGAVVAYNSGVSNVRTIEAMDRGTTHDDYGSDVIARAQFYGDVFLDR